MVIQLCIVHLPKSGLIQTMSPRQNQSQRAMLGCVVMVVSELRLRVQGAGESLPRPQLLGICPNLLTSSSTMMTVAITKDEDIFSYIVHMASGLRHL